MKSIEVRAERAYQVDICDSWQSEVSDLMQLRESLVVAPQRLVTELSEIIPQGKILSVPDGEKQKSFETLQDLAEKLAALGASRETLLIAIGGGATTDLTGFLAAGYLRGVDWVAVPTTVAGMVDAAIGGKTGINLASGKNLFGAFNSPIRVIVDTSWLETLSKRDKAAGLAESVKCGFIRDEKILQLIESNTKDNIREIIERSIKVKADVVSMDFRESGEREILNYGHTLGHAIERHSGYSLRHGEAISIGLVFAAKLSHRFGLNKQVVDRHIKILQSLNLPIQYEQAAWPKLYELMGKDKKRRAGEIRFVTINGIGITDRKSAPEGILSEVYREMNQ
ncbi:MAG TPA: 3-dehydroquinate synthase [Candidatus Nanopelagicaceae bacterium]